MLQEVSRRISATICGNCPLLTAYPGVEQVTHVYLWDLWKKVRALWGLRGRFRRSISAAGREKWPLPTFGIFQLGAPRKSGDEQGASLSLRCRCIDPWAVRPPDGMHLARTIGPRAHEDFWRFKEETLAPPEFLV